MKIKKSLVLIALFIMPLLFYIFLSNGIYNYANLPILTENVEDIHTEETFKDHFSIVCFLGKDLKTTKGKLFNLNEIIYKRYNKSLYFQTIIIVPFGTEEEVELIKKRLGTYQDASKWKFVFLPEEKIHRVFKSLETPYQLDANLSSDYTFIIDRELRLRGRKDDEDTKDGRLYGYNLNSVAILKNKMRDDIGVIYYQLGESIKKVKRNQQNQ